MNIKKLFNEDDSAVSPVIGVILMVAITVILAAVIASFVLGMGPNTSSAPTASFSSEYDSGSLEITMDSGQGIDPAKISFQADNFGGGSAGVYDSSSTSWGGATGKTTDIQAGDSITLNVGSGYSVSMIYTDGDTTSTMQTFED